MQRITAGLLCLLTLASTLDAAVQTKTIKYKDGDQECVGFLAWDDASNDKRPGVLVVHEWWGLNDYARSRAKEIAELGYIAFAADMYGDGKTVDHPMDAREMAGKVRENVQAWRKRAEAGLQVLTSQPQCDKSKLAAIGYCFGGSTALQLAYSGADLDAVATFHAALPTPSPEEAKSIKAEIVVNHGADDTFIPQQAIDAFKAALNKAEVKYEFISYPGVVHSFTVKEADAKNLPGMKYDKTADEQSWKKMKDLFARTLGK